MSTLVLKNSREVPRLCRRRADTARRPVLDVPGQCLENRHGHVARGTLVEVVYLLHTCPLGNFSWCARFIYQHTIHNTTTTPLSSLHFCPMPPKATTITKKWGQADRDLLANLTNRQLIDITDTSHQNIEQVRGLHFRHHDKKNFRNNFRNYSAAWDLTQRR